ncbi:MAG: substrate-binding domain-containing protein [Lachnospiraceae bacterium]|nr:substrate-binding domain-containing protein [Lachnospiraceae bacterium]
MKKWKLAALIGMIMTGTILAGFGSYASEDESEAEIYDIVVVIQGQDGEFWQTVSLGAQAAGEELEGKATVDVQGASSSSDFEGQLSLIENILTTSPDALVIGPASTSGIVSVVDEAMESGIKVTIIDSAIDSDNYDSYIATDNYAAGQSAAEAMIEKLEADGTELVGTVGVISPISGVQSVADRDNGFMDRIAELAPDIEILPVVYCDGDMANALSGTQDMYLANQDTLLGIFASADGTAGGVVSAIEESGIQGEFVVTAIDASDAEIEALENGIIYALVVQDPYNMGYLGAINSYKMLTGESVDKDVASATALITQENMDEEENQKLLFPLD